MADSKYISKVRIGNEDFAFRDKEALAAAQAAQTAANNISVPVDGVTGDITFKDANGKMYKLALYLCLLQKIASFLVPNIVNFFLELLKVI